MARNRLSRAKVLAPGMIGQRGTIVVPMSFESNEQTATKIYLPFKAKITKIRSIVVKALGGSDAGTVTPKNAAGTTMTDGVITHALSSALNAEQSATPSANNVIEVDSFLSLTSAKSTAGGKVLVSVEFVSA